jgi:hypothetical protein
MVNWKKKSPADTPAGLKTRMRVRISLMPQENIPCKSLMTVRRIGVSTPSEDVAVTVAASRFFIGPSDSLKAVRKALQLLRLGEAVVVSINPEQELLEDFIPGIDCTVKVSAHSGRVQIAQHLKTILKRGSPAAYTAVAEELRAVVDNTIGIVVQCQEGIGFVPTLGPCHFIDVPISV